MDEKTFEQNLIALLPHLMLDDDGDDVEIESARSFEDLGVLTNNKGLTITMDDGSEFQISIVRSK